MYAIDTCRYGVAFNIWFNVLLPSRIPVDEDELGDRNQSVVPRTVPSQHGCDIRPCVLLFFAHISYISLSSMQIDNLIY